MTALLVLAFGAILGVAEEPSDKPTPQTKVTIGKETTYITRPLRPDGYPDYVAALNEFCSRGVTGENNAAVLLQQASGRDSSLFGLSFLRRLESMCCRKRGIIFRTPMSSFGSGSSPGLKMSGTRNTTF